MSTRMEARFVRAWLDARLGGKPSAARLPDLMLASMGAIWRRAKTTLGEVTLAAIYERVLETTRRDHPILDRLQLELQTHGTFGLARDVAFREDRGEMQEAIVAILSELLHVLGNLTGQTILPGLEEELGAISVEGSERPIRTQEDGDLR